MQRMKKETTTHVLKILLIISTVFLNTVTASEKSRIAILKVENTNSPGLDVSVVEHYLRSGFVNSGKYIVLERVHMDKILYERSMNEYGVLSDKEAADLGKILKVQHIVISTVMRVKDEFFIEVRMVDVSSSTITYSKTGNCTRGEHLAILAKKLVEKICGIPIAIGLNDSDQLDLTPPDEMKPIDFYTIDTPKKTMKEVETEKKNMKIFRMIGISSYDYERFSQSGLSMNEWAEKDKRNPLIAGSFGVVTGTSGFFYTRDYGNALLITLTKAIGIVGMLRNYKKEGVLSNKYWTFTSVLSLATIGDIIGSAWVARTRNNKLDKIQNISQNLGVHFSEKTINTNYSFQF